MSLSACADVTGWGMQVHSRARLWIRACPNPKPDIATDACPPCPLSEAVEEYLQWLDLDRHASPGTVAGYRDELWRFQIFASTARGAHRVAADAGSPTLAHTQRLVRAQRWRDRPYGGELNRSEQRLAWATVLVPPAVTMIAPEAEQSSCCTTSELLPVTV
jgi:hypothetical protein